MKTNDAVTDPVCSMSQRQRAAAATVAYPDTTGGNPLLINWQAVPLSTERETPFTPTP